MNSEWYLQIAFKIPKCLMYLILHLQLSSYAENIGGHNHNIVTYILSLQYTVKWLRITRLCHSLQFLYVLNFQI